MPHGFHWTPCRRSSSPAVLVAAGVVGLVILLAGGAAAAARARAEADAMNVLIAAAVVVGVAVVALPVVLVRTCRREAARQALYQARTEEARQARIAAAERKAALEHQHALELAAAAPAPVVNVTNTIDPAALVGAVGHLALLAGLAYQAQPDPQSVRVVRGQVER